MKKIENKDRRSLYTALLQLKSEEEVARFMADLCTPGEVDDFSERWAIARLLDAGDMPYRDIAEKTGASTTTVARVARFLHQEEHQGYRLVLGRLTRNKESSPKKS